MTRDPETPTTPDIPAAPGGTTSDPADPYGLRQQLMDTITAASTLPAAVETAMRTVPRHEFLPGIALATAYADQAVTIKDNPHGPLALSCASVPSLVARMLAQLDVQPGDTVLEIGAGTGYNAALLAWLAGRRGAVTTVDIDADVIAHAQNALGRLAALDGAVGRDQRAPVTVLHGDGLLGAPGHGPVDRLVATVGMWDIPDAWWAQLVDGGTMVVPLRWRGLTRLVTLIRRGAVLVAEDLSLCGFVPVIGQDGERTTSLARNTVRLHHDADQPITSGPLVDLFACEPIERWAATRAAADEGQEGIWLRATAQATHEVCRIEITQAAQDRGLRPTMPRRCPALVGADSLAYVIGEREPCTAGQPGPGATVHLGAVGYGPHADALTRELVEIIDAWGADRLAVPDLRIYPSLVDIDLPPGARMFIKPDSRIVLSYRD